MNVKLFLLIVVTFLMFHANAQLKIGDQPTIQDKSVALDVKGSNGRQGLWLPRVSDTSITGIRALNPPNGLVIFHTPSGKLLLRSNNAWVVFLETAIASVTAGGAPMLGPALTFNTGTTGTDFNISSSGNTATWNLPDASATARGVINTSSQAFLGIKTFNTGVSVLGATGSASNLTLGITSATAAAAQTTKYLSVDATGKVTLNALNVINSVTAGGTLMTGPDLIYNTSTSGTDFSISTVGSTATWNLPNASATARGLVNTSAQAFLGIKTFNTGVSVLGATGSTSNLTLGLTSATTPGAQTTKYLTVDATGNVTLNAMNSITSVIAGGTTMTGPALTYLTSTTGTDFSISGSGNTATWNLPDASTTARGVINTSSQAFLGIKTFNTGVSVLGATGSTSNLTLGLTSATTAAAQTTKYLSVDATGNVTLNALNVINSVTAGGTLLAGPNLIYNTSTTGTDFSITGSGSTATWNLPDASATARGLVNTSSQAFLGIKTFNTGVSVLGATGSASNLTLGLTSATAAAAQTTKYLSVDATGKVTLNALNVINSVTAGGTLMTGPDLIYNTSTSGTDFSISTVGSTATWNLPDASATARGLVNTSSQAFLGIKTFNTGVSVLGATGSASNLTLGLTSATAAAAQTTKYLSVDATGKVTLNTMNALTSVTAGGTTMTGPALTYLTSTTGTDFSISGSGNTATWNLPDASATARGVVNTGAQTFAGIKTFSTGAIVSGATGATSNLTLGINSATTPAAQTTKYLSLDATGNVTLNAMNSITSVTAGGPAMTGPALTYNTGTTGTDFNIASSGNTATWNLPDASTTARGAVTTAAQTIGGLKTLANGVVVNNGSTLNNGTTANGGLSVTGSTTFTSDLTLGLTSATTPDVNTDKYLSVNASGKVTLNSVNVSSTVPVKIKAYHIELTEAPVWLRAGTPQIFTFVIPGANLSLTSSVSISPYKQILATTKINWVRVLNATTIQVAMSAEGVDQKLNPGVGNEADFFVTVMEF